jgi:transcriptional regulator with XRE-family HTH domain
MDTLTLSNDDGSAANCARSVADHAPWMPGDTRRQRGRRRGVQLTRKTLAELRQARLVAGVTQRTLARELGVSQALVWRLETERVTDVSLGRLCEVGAVLGLEIAITVHPAGEALRDRGHQAVIARLRALLAPAWHATAEAPFPAPGDPRHWDLLLRLRGQRVGVEAETRIRDLQALVRRMRTRLREGGVDHMVLVLSDSAVNRRLVHELREALGAEFATAPRAVLRALRHGEHVPGSAVVLL